MGFVRVLEAHGCWSLNKSQAGPSRTRAAVLTPRRKENHLRPGAIALWDLLFLCTLVSRVQKTPHTHSHTPKSSFYCVAFTLVSFCGRTII